MWLDAKGLDYEFVNTKTNPLSEKEILDILEEYNITPLDLINKRSRNLRADGISYEDLSTGEAMSLVIDSNKYLYRPIVLLDNKKILFGFKESDYDREYEEGTFN